MPRPVPAHVASVFIALVTAAAPAAAQIVPELVASGLTQPVAFVQDPSDPTVQVVVQQDGRVRVLKDGVVQATDFLDLRDEVTNSGEQGLLGLAFAPDYATSGRVYINFVDEDDQTVIARFTRSAANPLQAERASRFDFLWPDGRRVIEQPFTNHNGGHLAFGPDGYLYIGLGDGGSGNDPFHLAQNPQSLLGKMLRLDASVPDTDPEGYDIPPDNPFVGRADVLHEIWSFGLRNPWRWSFDDPAFGGNGAMLIGDVGQNAREEIDYEPAGRGGRNYGWRNREGRLANVTSLPPFSQPLIDPIHDYPRSDGQSVTGGHVYRGASLGLAARGRYFFGDFIRSRVWSLRLTVNPATGEATASDLVEHTAELGGAAANPSSFGVNADGELYIVNYTGTVHRLTGPGIPGGPEPPAPDPGPTPGPGRRRPAGAPVVGIAVPRPAGAAPHATGAAPAVRTVPSCRALDQLMGAFGEWDLVDGDFEIRLEGTDAEGRAVVVRARIERLDGWVVLTCAAAPRSA